MSLKIYLSEEYLQGEVSNIRCCISIKGFLIRLPIAYRSVFNESVAAFMFMQLDMSPIFL